MQLKLPASFVALARSRKTPLAVASLAITFALVVAGKLPTADFAGFSTALFGAWIVAIGLDRSPPPPPPALRSEDTPTVPVRVPVVRPSALVAGALASLLACGAPSPLDADHAAILAAYGAELTRCQTAAVSYEGYEACAKDVNTRYGVDAGAP